MIKFSMKASVALLLALTPQFAGAAIYKFTTYEDQANNGYTATGTVSIDSSTGDFEIKTTTTKSNSTQSLQTTLTGNAVALKSFNGDVSTIKSRMAATKVNGSVVYTGDSKDPNGNLKVQKFDLVSNPTNAEFVYGDGNKFSIYGNWTTPYNTNLTESSWHYDISCKSKTGSPDATSTYCAPTAVEQTTTTSSSSSSSSSGITTSTTGGTVPEPGVTGMFLMGAIGLLFAQRRRQSPQLRVA